MFTTQNPAVVFSDVSFAWPDGSTVFHNVNSAIGTGRTGLIGVNGTGKSTMLRLIAGELTPSRGAITATAAVGYLPQKLALSNEATIADLLGIRVRLDALHAIESGDPDPTHFDTIGDDWAIESHARALLDSSGLNGIGLERAVKNMSGGEVVLAALVGLRLAETPIVLLDEPTNNLDREARHQLYDQVMSWRGTLIVVSHDVTLLDLMDDTAELQAESLTVFGGNYSDFQDYLAQEQAAAERALRSAQQMLKLEQRQRVEAETKLSRRGRYARTDFENKRRPKIAMNQRKTEAQVSAGKLRGELDGKVETARQKVQQRAAQVRGDSHIRIDLPDPGVPTSRRLVELHSLQGRPILIQGPERVALVGRNGIGKTRLLETLFHPEGSKEREVYAVAHTDRIGYLPQRLDHLDDDVTIFETVRRGAPTTAPRIIRANLARFMFDAETIEREVGELSGGEWFRVALALLLLAEPPNQLLVLDEPTNNLDLASLDELVDAIAAYRGGLIIVSHDDAFLARLNINTRVTLDDQGLRADSL